MSIRALKFIESTAFMMMFASIVFSILFYISEHTTLNVVPRNSFEALMSGILYGIISLLLNWRVSFNKTDIPNVE